MASGEQLSRRVYRELLQRIVTRKLKPGATLNRRQVALELGVSVAPVLEALLELQTEGLVESLPRKGTRVRTLTRQEVWGQLVVREALECQAARLYCGEPVRAQQARLDRLAAAVDEAEPNSIELATAEIRFHRHLVSLSSCRPLVHTFDRVMKLGLLHSVHVLHPNPENATRSSHEDLVKQLITESPDEAEAAIREHVQSGKEELWEGLDLPAAGTPAASVPEWLER